MITDYPHNNSAERKGGCGGTDRVVCVTWACKCQISCSLVAEDKTFLCPLPIPNKKLGNLGWEGGALIASSKAVGLECVPPSSILLMLPLQIPCSLVVAKLMSNSCAPLPPTRLREIKESPSQEPQSLECCHTGAYVIGLG